MELGVVGAGTIGLTVAYDAAVAGHDVTVLERATEPPGTAPSVEVADALVERFPHHCTRNDRAMLDLVERLGLGDRMRWHHPTTGLFHEGGMHPFGTPAEMVSFPRFTALDRLRFAASTAALKSVRDARRFGATRALDWMRRWAGPRVTTTIWEPLLTGMFGAHAEDVSMAWLWARIHAHTVGLGYLHGGFAQVSQALLSAVTERGGKVECGKTVDRVRQPASAVRVSTEDGSSYEFDRLIVTTSEPECARLTGEDSDTEWEQHHLARTCFLLECERSIIPYHRLSIHDPDFPFHAVVEHTQMVDPADYGGTHLVHVSATVPRDDSRFTTSAAALLDRYVPWLRILAPGFAPDWIQNWTFTAEPFGQPIVTHRYRSRRSGHRTSMSGVTLASATQALPHRHGLGSAVALAQSVTSHLGISRPVKLGTDFGKIHTGDRG